MNYTTQMDAARKGIFTPQMKIVAEKEHMDEKKLMQLIGKARLPYLPIKGTRVYRRKRLGKTVVRRLM